MARSLLNNVEWEIICNYTPDQIPSHSLLFMCFAASEHRCLLGLGVDQMMVDGWKCELGSTTLMYALITIPDDPGDIVI